MLKHLSTIARDVIHRCSDKVGIPVGELVDDFEVVWKQEQGSYSRKFVEFCCTKALRTACCGIRDSIKIDASSPSSSFTRFTFDMMLAWQMPSYAEEESHEEGLGKEREDQKMVQPHEDVSLFYSDIMPLLVDHEPSVEEDTFVWFSSLVPLAADVVNARFTFETLTAVTAHRLHFPAYDKYIKEIYQCVKHLEKQTIPKGVELADDEFILHVEGTMGTQRVVRHIGGASWPGRLTLTNYALYFEASGAVSYDDALIISLSRNTEQSIKPTATGPFGAPLFDKAVIYQSSELSEGVILEFPEVASCTRRDHWLALVQEVILLHKFVNTYKPELSYEEACEIHARTILAIMRLHAAREMLRMSPPIPKRFLIFTLLEDLPKGDYILEELGQALKQLVGSRQQPCGASSLLRSLNMPIDYDRVNAAAGLRTDDDAASLLNVRGKKNAEAGLEPGGGGRGRGGDQYHLNGKSGKKKTEEGNQSDELVSSLDSSIVEAREEEKEIEVAKASTEAVKEEGVGDSLCVLMELLRPVRYGLFWCQDVLNWERPNTTVSVLGTALLVAYKEWVGKAMALGLVWVVAEIMRARKRGARDRYNKVVVYTGSEQSPVESLVSAQHGMKNAYECMQIANIAIMKIQSILVSRAEKHANVVMMAMVTLALVLAIVPLRYIIMGVVISIFASTSKLGKMSSNYNNNDSGNRRRLKEWWDSIPVVPVHIIDQVPPPHQ